MKTIEGLHDWNKHAAKQRERAAAFVGQAREAHPAINLSGPVSEADLTEAIAQYNEIEAVAHDLKIAIFAGLAKRTGYRMLRIGQADSFNGSPIEWNNAQRSAPALITVESLGGE